MTGTWRTVLGLLAVAGCTGADTLGEAPLRVAAASGAPTFLHVADSAPPLAAGQVSFWAVRGQTREAELRFLPRAGAGSGNRLVRLKVGRRSLVAGPDGAPIAPGDSIRITLTVVDSGAMIVEFQPAGLAFAPNRGAQLTMWYLEADHDFNRDGMLTAADTAVEAGLSLWGQETPADPWVRLPSVLDAKENEVETEIPGFTRYAVAY